MAKDKLTDYSATNASNTDVGGVNINEGMLPSDVNNAIREVMTHLKDFAEGTEAVNSIAVGNITVGGTVTATGNIELGDSGGVSTGRVKFGDGDDLQMYFDGTNSVISSENTTDMYVQANNIYLRSSIPGAENGIVIAGDGAVTAYYDNAAKLATTATGVDVNGNAKLTGTGRIIKFDKNGSGEDNAIYYDNTTANNNLYIGRDSSNVAFRTGGSERMRLTSAGSLGLGVTAPSQTLDINGNARVDGAIYLADRIYHDGDTNTSIRFPAADTISLNTAGQERVYITSAGNVGIGTVSPERQLHVEGAGLIKNTSGEALFKLQAANNSNSILELADTDDGNVGRIQYEHDNNAMLLYTNDSEKLRITSAGSLGLGTSAPSYKFHSTTSSGSDIAGYFHNSAGSGNGSSLVARGGANNATPNFQVQDYNGNADFTVIGTGNVGIGTASPDSNHKLEVASGGTAEAGIRSGNSSEAILNFGRTNDRLRGRIAYNNSSEYMAFWTNQGEKVRLTSAGRLGIGTDSPAQLLHVNSTGNVAAAQIQGASHTAKISTDGAGTIFGTTTNGYMLLATNNAERMRLDASGNLLVGKTSSNFGTAGGEIKSNGQITATASSAAAGQFNRLTSDGTILNFAQNNGTVGSVSVTGSVTTYNTTSDIRLKQDIEPLQATDKLMQMNPVSYSWKSDPDGPRSMGFIAQEMQEVMPEAVSTGDDDDAMMSMDYGRITPILVSALQDAHRKIEELAAEIAELKAN
jgi:hypothetical protein